MIANSIGKLPMLFRPKSQIQRCLPVSDIQNGWMTIPFLFVYDLQRYVYYDQYGISFLCWCSQKIITALLYNCVQLYTNEQRAVDPCFLMIELEVIRPKSTRTTTNTCQTMSIIDGSATPLLFFCSRWFCYLLPGSTEIVFCSRIYDGPPTAPELA
jgi:hypothetical protein